MVFVLVFVLNWTKSWDETIEFCSILQLVRILRKYKLQKNRWWNCSNTQDLYRSEMVDGVNKSEINIFFFLFFCYVLGLMMLYLSFDWLLRSWYNCEQTERVNWDSSVLRVLIFHVIYLIWTYGIVVKRCEIRIWVL